MNKTLLLTKTITLKQNGALYTKMIQNNIIYHENEKKRDISNQNRAKQTKSIMETKKHYESKQANINKMIKKTLNKT